MGTSMPGLLPPDVAIRPAHILPQRRHDLPFASYEQRLRFEGIVDDGIFALFAI